MISFVLISLVIAVVITGVSMVVRRGGAITGPALSPVAQQLVAEYNSLPADQRPFPDIRSLVAAIDEKHAVDSLERDRHFDENWSEILNGTMLMGGYHFTWHKRYGCNHNSQYNRCDFDDYGRLHRVIQEVHESVKEKQRVLAESKTAHSADSIKELEQALRSEAGLNRTFVQEFKELT